MRIKKQPQALDMTPQLRGEKLLGFFEQDMPKLL
jgi:hypothetical protein